MKAEDLKRIALESRKSIHEERFETFQETLLKEAKKGTTKVLVPAPPIPGLFYHDDSQEAFAFFLKEKGFVVKRESTVSCGVLQSPSWYLYIVYQ